MTALSEAAGGVVVPSLAVTLAYVESCDGDRDEWETRWHALIRALAPADAAAEESAAPYLGLASFGPEDAPLFFGRERLVRQLHERLAGSSFLALFGPSGAGKSSVLQAGLLPALTRAGAAGNGGECLVVLLTPGEQPLRHLSIRLANAQGLAAGPVHAALDASAEAIRTQCAQMLIGEADGRRLTIIVDQFEEAFTLCHDERERAGFVAALLAAAREPRVHVVLGMRADFYGHCAQYPALVSALQDNQVLIGPMEEDDLRAVVTGPARYVGAKVDPELVELVVDEGRGQVGALSLVSHALLETWRRRTGTSLTVAAFRATGGLRAAISQTAERVHGELEPAEQDVAKDVFLRLTMPGDGIEDTRRRASRDELEASQQGRLTAKVLDRLIAARLVVAEENTVTIAHEALIRSWPRLRTWLEEDRERLHAHRRLTEAAAEWEQHGRDQAFLYLGTRLSRWRDHPLEALNDLERAFLESGNRREAAVSAGRRRRVRLAVAVLVSATVVISLLAGFAVFQAGQAREQRDVALSRQLAAEARAELALNPRRGLGLARRAYGLWPTVEAESVLRQGIVEDHLLATVPGLGRAMGVALSPDGTRLAASSADGLVRVWPWLSGSLSAGPPVVLRGHRGEALSPKFSPDGRFLAVPGTDESIRVWDLSGGAEAVVLSGHEGPVWNVAFSPDGRLLASAGNDGTVRVWNLKGAGAPRILRGDKGVSVAVAFSPDGRLLAGAGHDATVRLWDLKGRGKPRVLRGHTGAIKNVAFSPDGGLLASVSVDGTARVWRTGGNTPPVVLYGHEGAVEGLAFSRDGHRLATTSDDSTIRIWSPGGTGGPLVLRGHERVVWGAAFSADGTRLVSAGDDGTVRVWDPAGMGLVSVLRGHEKEVWTAAFDSSGRRVFSGGVDGAVRSWDWSAGTNRVLDRHDGEVVGLGVSRDGRRLASAATDGTIRVADTGGETKPVVLRGHERVVWSAEFSPDGRWLASAGRDGTLRVWDLTGAAETLVRQADAEQIRDVTVSPDGRRLATGGRDGTVRIWDPHRDLPPLILRGHRGLVWAVAFSPDGRLLASAGTDGTVRIWPVSGRGEPLVLRGHQNMVWSVAFSPDGRWVAGTGHDGTARIWRTDVAAPPMTVDGFAATVESVEFSPEGPGPLLATAHGDGTVRLWRCTACEPIDDLLTRVDRRLAGE
ncbi:nSTAND1 domain-containing NTPase [Nonomuraea sp. NPDC003707]